MKKAKQKPIWIITAHSESGDDYGPTRYNHKPTKQDERAFIEKTGEELDCDGPGDHGSYVHLKVDKV